MTRLAVDLTALSDLIERMQRFGVHLVQLQSDVDARMRALHVQWTGDAAAAQVAAHEQWAAASAELTHALGVLRSILTTAHGNYSGAAAANRQMWAV